MERSKFIWLILFLAAVAAGIAVLWANHPEALASDRERARLVFMISLLVAVGASVIVGWRLRAGTAFRYATIWAGIAFVLILLFSFRHEAAVVFNRVGGELWPASPTTTSHGMLQVRRALDGHFYADATVDGHHVRFLVDTGAAGILLTHDDARRIGIDPRNLNFNYEAQTAAGSARAALVRLGVVQIGPITVRNIDAIVLNEDSQTSLLGMSFLNRLRGFDVSNDTLTMRP